MGVKRLKRLQKEAEQLNSEHDATLEEIASDLRIITGHDGLFVTALAGDGYGVNVDLDGNMDCTGLPEIIAVIEERGTITAQEILNMVTL